MKIGFLMYAWERVDPRFDSTLRLLHECCLRGHRVALTHPANLMVHHHVPYGNCRVVEPRPGFRTSPEAFHANLRFSEQKLPLSDFDAILIRLPPPLDSEILSFLDAVKDEAFLLNSVEGLRASCTRPRFLKPPGRSCPPRTSRKSGRNSSISLSKWTGAWC